MFNQVLMYLKKQELNKGEFYVDEIEVDEFQTAKALKNSAIILDWIRQVIAEEGALIDFRGDREPGKGAVMRTCGH